MATRVQSQFSAVFGTNVTAGNLLIVGAATLVPGDTLGISDTLGSTWNALCGNLTSGNLTARAWYAMNSGSGANTITVTAGGGVDYCTYEVSGCATSGALDATNAAAGATANGTSGTISVGGAGYLFGFIANDAGDITLAAPFTEQAVGTNNVRSDSGDNVVTNSGTVECTSTFGARNWVAVIANFLDAAGGATPSGPYLTTRNLRARVG